MNVKRLRYFLAVAQELNFRRAAEQVGISQPALSQQIRKLEKEVGVVLFKRMSSRVELTVAGKVFVERAREVLVQIEEAITATRQVEQGEQGSISIGYVGPAIYGVLPPLLWAFRLRYPNVLIKTQELKTAEQITALEAHKIDVGFLRLPIEHKEKLLRVLPVQDEFFRIALPEGHPLAKKDVVPLAALSEEFFILFRRDLEPYTFDRLVNTCKHAGFEPKIVQEANKLQTIVGLVAAGLGVAFVSSLVSDNFHRSGVVYRAITPNAPKAVIALAWPRLPYEPTVNPFADLVSTQLNQDQGDIEQSQLLTNLGC